MGIEDNIIEGESELEGIIHSETAELHERVQEKRGHIQLAIHGVKSGLEYYFRPKFFERSGKLYEKLGVKVYKKFVPTNGDYVNKLIKKSSPKYRFIYNKNNLEIFGKWTKIMEGSHTAIGSGLLYFTIDALSKGDYKFAGIFAGINAVTNVYPIMLQRYNRARVYNILGK